MSQHAFGCPQQTQQVCLACGAWVCGCHGTARGQCPVCYRGLLSNYYKPRQCGYKGCAAHAVAATPRVGFACLKHATERGGYKRPEIAAAHMQTQQPNWYTANLLRTYPELQATP